MPSAWSGLLLLGGAIGDTRRIRPILLGALVAKLGGSVGLAFSDGPLFFASRLGGLDRRPRSIIPIALASVATSYHGVARATAIGLAYGAYGAAGAPGPILLQVIPAALAGFAAAIVAAGLALWIARPRVPDLPRPAASERPYVVGTAMWGFGILMVTTGAIWFGGLDNPARWLLVFAGLAVLAVAAATSAGGGRVRFRLRDRAAARSRSRSSSASSSRSPRPSRCSSCRSSSSSSCDTGRLGIVAVAPLFAALVLAGPVAGLLLARVSPRTLVGAGVVAVGAGNLAMAFLIRPDAGYLGFILPCLLIGAGFVIATTVRTAIIFASVPRGLPATAAAVNEASISIGSRIGVVVVTALVAQFARPRTPTRSPATVRRCGVDRGLPGRAHGDRDAGIQRGRGSHQHGRHGAVSRAYAAGIQVAFVFGGVIAVVAGVDPVADAWPAGSLMTVSWDHRDERGVLATEALAVPPGP